MNTELPQVAGRRITGSNEDFERAALVCLMHHQDQCEFTDTALVHVLCEAVRLCREYTDHAGAAETKALIDRLHAAVEAAWREGLNIGHSTDNYFPDEWWPKSKAFKALNKP